MEPRKNKAGGRSLYDEKLKIAVARDYITGNLSHQQVAKKHNITGGGQTVRGFVRWYQKHFHLQLSANNSPPTEAVSNHQEQVKTVRELEKQLSDANLKIAALEIMIEIAEKDLGIEIRKKPGTKQ
jgi:transposase-like protein